MNFELNTDNINFTLNLEALDFFVNGVGNPAPPITDDWILDTGFWNDSGVWQDDDFWND